MECGQIRLQLSAPSLHASQLAAAFEVKLNKEHSVGDPGGGAWRDSRAQPGRVVQVGPLKPKLRLPRNERLKQKNDELLSSFCFHFNLRRYSLGPHYWLGWTVAFLLGELMVGRPECMLPIELCITYHYTRAHLPRPLSWPGISFPVHLTVC